MEMMLGRCATSCGDEGLKRAVAGVAQGVELHVEDRIQHAGDEGLANGPGSGASARCVENQGTVADAPGQGQIVQHQGAGDAPPGQIGDALKSRKGVGRIKGSEGFIGQQDAARARVVNLELGQDARQGCPLLLAGAQSPQRLVGVPRQIGGCERGGDDAIGITLAMRVPSQPHRLTHGECEGQFLPLGHVRHLLGPLGMSHGVERASIEQGEA